jgi:hypothetical protein
MKKILLLSAVACGMLLYACKKDATTDTTTPVTELPADTIDPIALSASLQVGYSATSDSDNIPAASADADAPVLDPLFDNRSYYAINGRYIVIKPHISTGSVKGYYLQVNGAKSHFKIDYTIAYGIRKAQDASGLRDGDNADSSIVIKLPANLLQDTFSIRYAAYDSLNRVSSTQYALINVFAAVKTSDDSALLGSWTLVRQKTSNGTKWDSMVLNSSTYYDFYCSDDKLMFGTMEGQPTYNYVYSTNTSKTIMQFSAGNAANITSYRTSTTLDIESSSCSNLVYLPYDYNTVALHGGYSYNSTTKVLTLIYDKDGKGTNTYTQQYTVSELTSGKLLLYTTSLYNTHDQIYVNYYEYLKN